MVYLLSHETMGYLLSDEIITLYFLFVIPCHYFPPQLFENIVEQVLNGLIEFFRAVSFDD